MIDLTGRTDVPVAEEVLSALQEAYATSIAVRMPHGTELRVASAPAQTALKVLAWRDRRDVNPKDGLDLRVILSALSEDPFVEEVWDDLEALDATDYDIIAAASYHYARQAARDSSQPMASPS